ncbi:hypothetical protein ACFQ3Z_37195 [Streptomyces nogalater]
MGRLRQDVDPAEAGLDAGALERLDRHFARYVDQGGCPASWWRWPAAAGSPI